MSLRLERTRDILSRKRIIPRDEGVCFWHTGGTPALFGQAALLQPENLILRSDFDSLNSPLRVSHPSSTFRGPTQ